MLWERGPITGALKFGGVASGTQSVAGKCVQIGYYLCPSIYLSSGSHVSSLCADVFKAIQFGEYIGTGSFGSESILALYALDIGTLFFPN